MLPFYAGSAFLGLPVGFHRLEGRSKPLVVFGLGSCGAADGISLLVEIVRGL